MISTMIMNARLAKNILKKTQTHQLEIMILDPPRSGFTKTAILAHEWKPTHIYYVSCAPIPLCAIQEIYSPLTQFDIQLFDMFQVPSFRNGHSPQRL